MWCVTVVNIKVKHIAFVLKMAIPNLQNLQNRPPWLEVNPGTHELRYKLPNRKLEARELMKIFNELDFIERFTDRYSFLFTETVVDKKPHLLDMYNEVIITLQTMRHHGIHSGAHCSASQLHLLTASNTADYLTAVKNYSVFSWDSLTPQQKFRDHFPFFEEDIHTLRIMELSLHTLLHEICPLNFIYDDT